MQMCANSSGRLCVGSIELPVAGNGWRAVAGGEVERFLWTDLHTIAATNTAQTVDTPPFLCPIDGESAGGAFLRAHSTIDAVLFGEHQLPTRSGDDPARFKWITAGGRFSQGP